MKALIATLVLIVASTIVSRVEATALSEVSGADSFSSDFQNPTTFNLELGSNVLSGEVGRIVDELTDSGTLLQDGTFESTDADYFTVVVPPLHRLDQILVNRYNTNARGFAAYAPGVSFGPPTDLGGGTTFFPFSDGTLFDGPTDLTPFDSPSELFLGSATPFDPSDPGFNVEFLPAGSYALLIQENQIDTVGYEWEFVVSAVPEPATEVILLFSLFVGTLGMKSSRR